jgi:signal transduction histidine kinase
MSSEETYNRLEALFSKTEKVSPEPEKAPVVEASQESLTPQTAVPSPVEMSFEENVAFLLANLEQARVFWQSITALIQAQFDCDYADFYFYDQSTERLILHGSRGSQPDREVLEAISFDQPEGDSVLLQAAKQLSPVVSSIDASAEGLSGDYSGCEIAIPVIVAEALYGVLHLVSIRRSKLDETTINRIVQQVDQINSHLSKLLRPDIGAVSLEGKEPLGKIGWEDFFDGISHPESLSFSYSARNASLIPIDENTWNDNQQIANLYRSEISSENGETIGALQFEPSEGHVWQKDELALIREVSKRLSQKIENLRLLDEATYYRSEAEKAIQHLVLKNWETYLADDSAFMSTIGYAYDQNQVSYLVNLPDDMESIDRISSLKPLVVQNQMIGEIKVESPQPLSISDETFMDNVADRLSAHIENLRLAEQRTEALSEMEYLYRISAELSSSQSLDAALQAIASPAVAAGANLARLYTIETDLADEQRKLFLAAEWNKHGEIVDASIGIHYDRSLFPFLPIWKKDFTRPLLVANIDTDQRISELERAKLVQMDILALAALPLHVGEQWVGVIYFYWQHPRQFSDTEERLYRSLSNQAAVVINNLLLLAQTQKRARELETVARVSTAASSLLSKRELLQSIVDLTRKSFDLYHAQVYLLDPDRRSLFIAASVGEVGRKMMAEDETIDVNNSRNLVAQVTRDRQGILINDIRLDPKFSPHPLLMGVRSECAVPMIVGDEIIGVFEVQSDKTYRFNWEDMIIFSTLAAQVAVAVANAELYEKQAETVKRLQELDHLKSDFLANMSHELRTPLNSIIGFADVIQMELDGPVTDAMNNDLGLIIKNGRHLLNLINDVLDMSKIQAGKMRLSLEQFDIRDLINETIELTQSQIREKPIQLKVELKSQKMTADRTRLQQALINLIGNAIKFTQEGHILVGVDQSTVEDRILIRIQDSGIGIPPDKLNVVFEAFSQVDTSTTRKVGGTGLGLPISRSIVEMQGGRLWAESKGIPGQGSTFFIEMPIDVEKALAGAEKNAVE